MSRLTKLMAKPEVFEIGGMTFSFEALTVENMDLILALEDTDVNIRTKALKELINLSIKKAVPDSTEEEIKGISLKYLKEINQAILKVNGIKDEPESKDTKTSE